jgi:cleavage and polyadenylation specificity factor subunit 1
MAYKPFMASSGTAEKRPNLCFYREMNHVSSNAPPEEQAGGMQRRTRRLRTLPDISGHSTVFLPGHSAAFVFRTSTSSPHVIRLREEFVRGLGSFDSLAGGCDKGFVYLDSKVHGHFTPCISPVLSGFQDTVRICQLPHETQFDYPLTVQMVPIGEQVEHLAYSASSETYVLGTSHRAGFKLPDDDELHPEWRNEGLFGFSIPGCILMITRYFLIPGGRGELCQGRQPQDMVYHRQVCCQTAETLEVADIWKLPAGHSRVHHGGKEREPRSVREHA